MQKKTRGLARSQGDGRAGLPGRMENDMGPDFGVRCAKGKGRLANTKTTLKRGYADGAPPKREMREEANHLEEMPNGKKNWRQSGKNLDESIITRSGG